MPALARVREQAKAVLCQSNLKQMAAAFGMYTGDNEGYFPEGYGGLPDCATHNWWSYSVKPYYQSPDVCLCPVATKLGVDIGRGEIGATFHAWSAQSWFLLPPYKPGEIYGSFGINGWVEHNRCPDESENNKRRRWRHDAVKSAGNIPLILDDQWIDGWPQDWQDPPVYEDQDYRSQPGSAFVRFMINRHNGYVNGAFVDYSVRPLGLKELYTLKWNRLFDTSNRWTLAGDVNPSDWPEWLQKFKEY
jgi:prepilin-type processing-associated H-X9-DG protein